MGYRTVPPQPTLCIRRHMVHTTSALLRFLPFPGVLRGTRACGPCAESGSIVGGYLMTPCRS